VIYLTPAPLLEGGEGLKGVLIYKIWKRDYCITLFFVGLPQTARPAPVPLLEKERGGKKKGM
jgi:hypothetical protein